MPISITEEELGNFFWDGFTNVCSSIDAIDRKDATLCFINCVLLKRLSDQTEEEEHGRRSSRRSSGNATPVRHLAFVPPDARWKMLQSASIGPGEALNRAWASIAEANPWISTALAPYDFVEAGRLADHNQRVQFLNELVRHLSQVDLRDSALASAEVLGGAIEHLFEKMAADEPARHGSSYTPRDIARLLVELIEPMPGMRVSDPACGLGSMLAECARYAGRQSKSADAIYLCGQELDPQRVAICKTHLMLLGTGDARIEAGDTIRDPKLRSGDGLMRFDRVLSNPPFAVADWGREAGERDTLGRFKYGLPPRSGGALAMLQHMLATLNSTGRLGIIVPLGTLFRGSAEADIRRGIVEDDLVEAVIEFPPSLFYGTGIPTAVILINRDKKEDRKQKVLFVDATSSAHRGRQRNVLGDEEAAKIVTITRTFAQLEGYSRAGSLSEIKENDYSLRAARYVGIMASTKAPFVEHQRGVQDALMELHDAEAAREEARSLMHRYLRELGYVS